jgi:two-component system, cell cycle sensor histidine kinase and response regulator CckA
LNHTAPENEPAATPSEVIRDSLGPYMGTFGTAFILGGILGGWANDRWPWVLLLFFLLGGSTSLLQLLWSRLRTTPPWLMLVSSLVFLPITAAVVVVTWSLDSPFWLLFLMGSVSCGMSDNGTVGWATAGNLLAAAMAMMVFPALLYDQSLDQKVFALLSLRLVAIGMVAFFIHRVVSKIDQFVMAHNEAEIEKLAQADHIVHQKAQLEAILQTSEDGIMALDQHGDVVFSNPRLHALLDLSGQSPAIRTERDFINTIDRQGLAPLAQLDELFGAGPAPRPMTSLKLASMATSQRVLTLTVVPVVETPQTAGFQLIIVRDITASEEAGRIREELQQTQKMEAIGRLAGGIAHDFNNLLTIIIGTISMMRSDLSAQSPYQEDLADVIEASERAALLTRQLLVFSRKDAFDKQALDLNRIVRDSNKMLRRLIGEDIQLQVDLHAQPCFIRADPSHIEQVIWNLVVNARDAMPNGGLLSVTTRLISDRAGTLAKDSEPGSWVQFIVKDTGCGIPEHIQAQIFEPFFTTKRPGKGTGIGLSTVHGIVSQNGGTIQVESAQDEGTMFLVSFPVVTPTQPKATEETQPFDHDILGTHLLVVEDEDAVRKVISRALRAAGYRVTTASSAEDALDTVAQLSEPVDFVLTDIVMPGMNGVQLVERLLETNPELLTLYMSGYTADVITRAKWQGHKDDLITKPFLPEFIVAKVAEVLSRKRPPSSSAGVDPS